MIGRILKSQILFALLVLAICAMPILGYAQEEPVRRINAHLSNEIIPLSSSANTVAGFLNELSISLPPGADIQPSLDSAILDGMNIVLDDLTVTRGEVVEPIPVEIKVLESWRYGVEGFELVSPGRAGLRRVSFTIFYYEDHEVGRRRRENIERPMEPMQIVYYRQLTVGDGPSKEQILEMRLPPGDHHVPPTRYRQVKTMLATAYEPGPQSCGKFASGFTSHNYEAGYGVVAVDPDVIPMHSRLFIEGYGYAIAGDRGGAIKGNRIDLGYLTVDECYDWGRKEVKVYILY